MHFSSYMRWQVNDWNRTAGTKLFLLAKERKEGSWMTNPWRKTRILLLSGRTRPLRSHYLLCYYVNLSQGNPMHWDSRLDHHKTKEWVLIQWNVCFYFKSLPVLIKEKDQVEVERERRALAPVDMLRWTSLHTARSERHCVAARSWRSPR